MAEELNKKDIEELRRLIKLLNKDISEVEFESLVKSGKAAKTLLSSLSKEAEALTSDIGDINDGFKNIVNEIKRTNSTTNDVAKSFDRLSSVAEQVKFHQRGISQLSLKEIQSSQTKVAVEKERLRDSISSLTQRKSELQTQLNELNIKKATVGLTDTELKERRKLGQEYEKTKASLNNINSIISGQDELYNGLVTTIGKVKNQIEDSNKLLGLGGNVITGLSESLKTIGLGKLSDQLGIDEAQDKMKSLSQQIIADREREINLQNNIKNLSGEAAKIADQLIGREKELLNVKEKISLIDTLTQRKDEIRLQLEELNAKKASIGLTQNEIKERKKLGQEYKNLKISLEDLGSIKSAKELEDSLERQVEIIKKKKEEVNNVIEAEKKELDTVTATNKQYEGMGGKISVLKTGLTSMGGSLFKNLTDPLTISLFLVKSLVGTFLSADTAIGELAKGFNMTYSNALKTRQELTSIAAASGDAAVNTDGLQQSMMAIGQSLGSNARLNEKDLITFTKLREQAGYTNEELIGMQKLTLATGGNLEDNTKQFLGTVKVLSAQNKLVLNEKQLLKEVSNVSNAIKLSLGGSVKNLAEAAVKTKQFGINLDQADKIAGGLLDFEKSINAELEAELLTGKDLNLDKARLLALNGDIAGASAEILKQVGGTAEFSKMNRIQQEAMANAVGLTRDELANSLVEREALVNLSGIEGDTAKERYDTLRKTMTAEEAAAKLGNEALATQFEQQSTQEKFNQAIVKLQDLMVKLVEGPFGTFLEGLSNAVGLVGDIIAKFGKLGDYLKGLLGEDVAGVLGKAASIAAVGALAGVIGKSLLRGTSFNPLWVKVKGGMGGIGPDTDIDEGLGGGGPGGKGKGKPGGVKRLKQAFKGGGFKGVTKAAGRMLKSGAPKLLKGGGLASLAGGLALDYASSKQFEKQAQLEQEAQLIIDEKEKKKKLEEAEKAKNIGKGLDVGSSALSGAGTGALIGSFIMPGIGTAVGAGIGGVLGAGYGLLSNFGSDDKTKKAGTAPEEMDAESMEDFILRPGQRPIKYNKGDIIIGGTNLDKNLTPTISPSLSLNNANTISSPVLKESTKEIDINVLVNTLATELRDIKTILRDTLNIDKEMSSNLRDSNRKETQITLDGTRVGTAFNVNAYKTQ